MKHSNSIFHQLLKFLPRQHSTPWWVASKGIIERAHCCVGVSCLHGSLHDYRVGSYFHCVECQTKGLTLNDPKKETLTTELVLAEIKQTKPLSVLMKEKLDYLRAWAAERTVPAD